MMFNDTGMNHMQLYLGSNIPQYMERFAFFACKELGLDRLRGEITIRLGRTLDGESYGLCWGDRQEAEIHIATKQWGKSITREDKLKTLAHELTHAHQYLSGALKCDLTSEEFKSVWHKKEYRYLPDDEADLPWEVSARYYEELIYKKWQQL